MTSAGAPQTEPTSAIITIPNLLTFFRLGLLAPMLYFALVIDRLDLVFLTATLAMVTDLVDGRIARSTGSISRLGILLDPLADRLGVVAGAVAIIAHDLAPLWAVLVVVGRDVLLLAVGAGLKAGGRAIPPVSRVGKWGSFATAAAVGLFIASGWSDPADPIEAVRVIAWIVYAIGVPLYWVAAVGYARAAFPGARTTG
jgi:cardiolipin synthase